jgi:flagellar motor component MotA
MKKEPVVIIYEPRIDYLNLYCLNLQVYVNAQYIVCEKFEDLLTELRKKSPDLILINLFDDPKLNEKLSKLNQMLKDKFVKPITYVSAKTPEKYSELTLFGQDIKVKELVSTIAKKMGITAKYMSEQDVGEYYPLPIKYLLPGWQATQTIFKKNTQSEYVAALAKGKIFTKEFIDSHTHFFPELYCKSSMRLEVINSFTSNIQDILDSEILSNEDRFIQTEIAFDMISESVRNIGLPETTMSLAKSSIRSMEKVITGISSLSKLYRMLIEENSSTRFKRSIISSYIGQFVLKDQSWNNPNITQQWSYLCFFHDIILDRDELAHFEYDEDVKKSNLSDREKALVLNHAQMAAKIISQTKEIPIGIDVLIKQHHGSKMGNSLSEISMSISPLSIIFILVENYVKFILSDNERAKKPEEVISYIDSLFKKYPYPNYKKLIPVLRTIPLKD